MGNEKLEIKVLRGSEEEIVEVQRVLEEAPDYCLRISGSLPSSEDGKEVFAAIAPGKDYDDKFVFGIYLKDKMIGCIDLCRGYPVETTVMLGLLILSEKYQKRGLGTKAYNKLEKIIKNWKNINRIRIGVLVPNDDVLPFWKKMGFTEKGRKPYKHGKIDTEVITLEKSIL